MNQFCEYFTPTKIFTKFILPEIKDNIYHYIWIDLFAGSGNLILPILELLPKSKRTDFFREHIFLFDIQENLVDLCILNTKKYGIPEHIARNNILQRDTIRDYPTFLFDFGLPIYHITNPPYLYASSPRIRKEKVAVNLKYFKMIKRQYQDLYQIAMINDLRHGIEKMIYIIPSNFLFANLVSNKIRGDFLKYYKIKKAILPAKNIFSNTQVPVVICFFEKKKYPKSESVSFEFVKIINKSFGKLEVMQSNIYKIDPKMHYKIENEFDRFINNYKSNKAITVKYYLTSYEIKNNQGNCEILTILADSFSKYKRYKKLKVFVNKKLYDKIKSNILFVKTLDNTKLKAGIYKIKDIFGVDGILVETTKRTQPIHLFLEPKLTHEEQELLMHYFNLLLQYFRDRLDSIFMTDKYGYIGRKYLSLTQTKKLIQTFPLLNLNEKEKTNFKSLLKNKFTEELISFVKKVNKKENLNLSYFV